MTTVNPSVEDKLRRVLMIVSDLAKNHMNECTGSPVTYTEDLPFSYSMQEAVDAIEAVDHLARLESPTVHPPIRMVCHNTLKFEQ